MDRDARSGITPGMAVFGVDGAKVGKIAAVSAGYLVVEKGFFFPTDRFIPLAAVASTGEAEVYLSVTKAEALEQGWELPPLAGDTGSAVAESAAGAEVVRVPVYEEELTAVTRPVERGAIRIEKILVTEERTITVPVTEERVIVTRVEPGTPGALTADDFENGVIEIPIRGEEVDVEKTVRLAGEVVVEKDLVQRTERVGGAVRREEVSVDDQLVDGDTERRGDGDS